MTVGPGPHLREGRAGPYVPEAYSLYGYLSMVRVQRGTTVEAGALVGDVGNTPDGDAGLYLEVRIDGRPVDPVLWLERAT